MAEQFEEEEQIHDIVPVSGMYESWFLDYASYVILERAVPAIEDGFKPVQRRIMHSLKEVDDGRFNKVANVIGHTMQYHPHGDASIGDAIVNLGQKDLLIETQGNWGDVRTGDSAAAPRYIEARLSKFALEVVFNPKTTDWQLSYDGRKKEPVTLPVKFPLLLAQGVEGIAVGLSTKILPHNFCELINASIDHLTGKSVEVYPDFGTAGFIDITDYQGGKRGGRVKVRAKVEIIDKKQIAIREIPFGTTTNSLIDSIIKANDKGKIKIKKIIDNTAKDVEILVQLAAGQSPEVTLDALYAFTDCEVSVAPNACVIVGEKPQFLTVDELLKISTDQTVDLLEQELKIREGELLEKILFSSLEKIFIENRIYRDIEECETWEAVLEAIDKGLEPFKAQFYREIVEEDLIRLTEIKIKRISKYDSFQADEQLKRLNDELAQVRHDLVHLIEFAIAYFTALLEKFGKGRERKTQIQTFDTIAARRVAATNQKLYINRKDGFVGYGLKKDEFISECSDLDDIIVFRKDGVCKVSKIVEKNFMGKNILHASVFKKNDERMVYHLIYLDGASGRTMVKRFQVLAITRDKEYMLTKGTKGSKVLYFSANPNGESELVHVVLSPLAKARKKAFDFDFGTLEIKGRGAGGNILTKYPIKKIDFKSKGKSTLGGTAIWYDQTVGKFNKEERGTFLGEFQTDEFILVIYKNGEYVLSTFELTHRFDDDQIYLIEKFDPEKPISVIYKEGKSGMYFVKRFLIETTTAGKPFSFVSDTKGTKLIYVTTVAAPLVEIKHKDKDKKMTVTALALADFIDIKGWKSQGNRLGIDQISKVTFLSNLKEQEEEEESFDSGDQIELDVDKGQLGLF